MTLEEFALRLAGQLDRLAKETGVELSLIRVYRERQASGQVYHRVEVEVVEVQEPQRQ